MSKNKNQKKSPLEKLLPELEAESKDLEKEWERLDSMGNMVEQQAEIASRIAQLMGMVAFLKDYLKWKDK